MSFIENIKKRAVENKKTIVLPETEDSRILEAASLILKEGIANIVLLANEKEVLANCKFDLSKASFIEPSHKKLDDYVNSF